MVGVTEELKELDITTPKDAKSLAEQHKLTGNKFFAELHYSSAIEQYTQAIEYDSENVVYYCNRAAAYIKLESYGAAVQDATQAIKINKQYVKAYYRRATAYYNMNKLKDAIRDYKSIVQLLPNDKDAKLKLSECEKQLHQIAFYNAIKSDDAPLPSTLIKPDDISVDSSYTGPRLSSDNKPDERFIDELIPYYKSEGKLHRKYIYHILLQACELFKSLPTLIDIDAPVDHIDNTHTYNHITVCGDVHGQYYDLLNIFELNGRPSPSNPYLFNGDFVDRGSYSVEIIVLFLTLKLVYPKYFHMLRGNHESHSMNTIYGFKGEVDAKIDNKCYELFTELFCYLPLAAVIGQKVLVLHGGLFATDGVTLDDIRKIDRNRQPADTGLMAELMWSDPQNMKGRAPSKRGVGLSFGPDVTERFLKDNNLELLVRSHEVKEDGYQVDHNGKCITVFSAPNYCDSMGNKGAYITFKSDMKPNYTTFTHVEHPKSQPMQFASPMLRFGG